MTLTSQPAAAQAFLHWVDSKQSAGKKLDRNSAAKYASIWNVWVQSLPASLPWQSAEAEHVAAWLQSLMPSATARRSRANVADGPASTVTRRRYWRVVRDVYEHAVQQRWVSENPCQKKMAVPRSEAMASMILSPRLLALVHRHLAANDEATSWQSVRDRCLKLLILATAAKTGEIVQLRADQVWSMSVAGTTAYTVELVRKNEPDALRRLVVDDGQTVAAITEWRKARLQVEGCPPWMFFSAKRESAMLGVRKPMTPKSVFTTCAQTLEACLPRELEHSMLAHAGAECLRNSVISLWLGQGMSAEQVLHLSGLGDARSLARLSALKVRV